MDHRQCFENNYKLGNGGREVFGSVTPTQGNDSSICVHYLKGPFKNIDAETNGRHFPDDIFKGIFVNENE